MRVSTYGELSELISDLAHLDKKIGRKRYRAILDALESLPYDDFRDGQVMEYLKTLAFALERIARGPDGRPLHNPCDQTHVTLGDCLLEQDHPDACAFPKPAGE